MGRIAYYVPDVGFGPAERERRHERMREMVPARCRIEIMAPPGRPGLDEFDDDPLSARDAVREDIPRIGPERCDVILWGEALDVLLDVARPVARVPIVAPGEETLRLAAARGLPTAMLVMHDTDAGLARELAARVPEAPVAAVRSMNMTLRDVVGDGERALEALEREARAAVERDGARALYLGAMSLCVMGVAPRLRASLGVEVFEPLQTGLEAAARIAMANA